MPASNRYAGRAHGVNHDVGAVLWEPTGCRTGCAPGDRAVAEDVRVHDRDDADPDRPILGIDHVALRVRSVDEAVDMLTATFGFVETARETTSDGVRVCYVSAGNLDFEVFEAADSEPGIDHLALRVASTARAGELLAQRGLDVGIDDIRATRGAVARVVSPDSVCGLRMHLCERSDDPATG